MGKADEYQFDYLEDNYRFADQVNGEIGRASCRERV